MAPHQNGKEEKWQLSAAAASGGELTRRNGEEISA